MGRCLLAAILLCLAAASAAAEDDPMTDEQVVVKTEGAHRLLLPNDWPIQQKEGHLAPAPVEEYLSMKFGQVRSRFSQTDAQMNALRRRIDELEGQSKALWKGFKEMQERIAQQEGGHGHQKETGEENR